MRLLAFDTAGDGCSAGIFTEDGPLALRWRAGGMGHAELLPPMLETVLGEVAGGLEAIDALAVTIGPGSFTGIRTGLAMARGLALVTGLRVLPVTTLAALAAAARPDDETLPLHALLDARRGQVFQQIFPVEGEPQSVPQALTPEAAAATITAPARLAGSGVALVLPHLSADQQAGLVSSDGRLDARAVARAAFIALARGASPVPGPALRPLYARPADARPDAGRALLQVGV